MPRVSELITQSYLNGDAGLGQLPAPFENRFDQVNEQLADITLNIKAFGAVGDGVTDDYDAIMAAHDALPASGGNILVPDGVFRILQGLGFTKRVYLLGKGYTTNEGSAYYAPSCILKDGNFDAITFKNPGSMIKNIQIAGNVSDTGNGIVFAASRCVLDSVSVTNNYDGLRIGDDIGSNANLWRVTNLVSLGNVRYSMYVHAGGGGLPDTNAGILVGLDARGNGVDGIALGNTIDNSFYGVCCQQNGGWGVRLYAGAYGNKFFAPYCEANTAGEFLFDVGTKQNLAFGARQGIVFDGYVNNGSASNLIIGSDGQQTDYPFYVRTPLSFKEIVTTDNSISGVWRRYQNATDRALTESLTGTSSTPVSIRDAHENGGVIIRDVMQLRIGSGSVIKAHYWSLGSRDFAPIAAQSTGETTITVNGAAIGDTVFASPNTTLEAGLVYGGAWVSAVNTVTIRLGNITAASIDPAARGWYVDVWHH